MSAMKKTVISSHPSHQIRLCSTLNEMRRQGKFCDVCLQCNGKPYFAHKVVLAAHSKYLENLLEEKIGGGCGEDDGTTGTSSRVLRVDLPIGAKAMQTVLDFVYAGRAEFIQADTSDVMKAAHLLNMATMYECCKATLLEDLTLDTYYQLWNLAESFEDKSFLNSVVYYAARNFNELSEENDFLKLNLIQMKQLLSNEIIIDCSQDKVLEGIVSWVKKSRPEREEFLSTLLSFVQFEKLTRGYLKILLDEEQIVWDSTELMRHVTKTLSNRYFNTNNDSSSSTASQNKSVSPLQDTASVTTNEETEPAIAILGENEEKKVILQFYSIDQDEWCPPEELDLEITNMAAVELNGYVYLIGGKAKNGNSQAVYSYHVLDRKLFQEPKMHEPRNHPGVATLDGNIYVVGGSNSSGYLRTVECYDPEKQLWSHVAPLREQRVGVAVASLKRRLYAIGGRAGQSMDPVSTVECFELATGQWTAITPMLIGRSHCGVTVLQRRVFVTGGYAKESTPNDESIQCFNPINKMWNLFPSPPVSDWVTAAVACTRYLYVMSDGGQLFKFDPERGIWIHSSTYPTLSGYYTAAVLVQKPVWDA